MEEIIQKTKQLIDDDSEVGIRKQFKNQLVAYIVGALGFVAGLAWNEAIKGAIDYIFPFSNNGLLAKFIYAVFITLIVIFFALYLSRRKDK